MRASARTIPMPAILRHTGSGARTFDGRTHRSWHINWYIIDPDLPFGDPAYDANERPFTPEEKAALADIGLENWYDWSVANWGTKWNAVRAATEELPGEDGAHEIRFDTAWSAPFPVYHKIAALFRQLPFEFSWTDEDQDHITHSMRIRRFNTDAICLPCERDEKLLPLYPHAVDAERAASRPAPSPGGH